ncbi:MAG: hypothetical protein LC112_10710 [Flavobacteriales bacterium]|nr:hypothetical protein [Flavobacteriales bacterium]
MLDNLKFITYDQTIIRRLAEMPGFVPYQHRNNNYAGFCKYGKLMRFDFRKSFENGIFAGYHHLEISISPHYHYNNYLHNGNDFPPQICIETVSDMLRYVSVKPDEMDTLKVVNIEFGLNLIPETNIQNLITNILFSKKTPFIIPKKENGFFKITNATAYKQIKAYAKGLQFTDFPQYGINANTFRFEVKSKKSVNIKKYGIDTIADLLKIDIYRRLGQELLNEWENVLLTTSTPDLSTLKPSDVLFVQKANKKDFWTGLIGEFHRDKFAREKAKYYKILTGKNNLHTQIKGQIIDKLLQFENVAYFPQKTPINSGKDKNAKLHLKEINGQFATNEENNRLCLVTGLDISMQKKTSKYLCFAGLKYYKENDPETYKEIELKYLTLKMKTRPIKDQIYYIAHNIRNHKTNPNHNPRNSRERFEKRHYPKQQLQFNFN